MANWIPARPALSHVDDYIYTVKGWIDKCQSHAFCPKVNRTRSKLPTRVIAVGPVDGSIQPYLYESGGRLGEWVTLSHCWGNAYPITLTMANLGEHKAQMLMESLPPLFQDAVTITRALGYQYLWVDSLCIIQDSENDWRFEAAKMGYIYKYSSLTIAAESSRNCRDGIFVSSNYGWPNLSKRLRLPCLNSNFHARGNIYPQLELDAPVLRDYLGSRAWTLQEEILSPRAMRWTTRGLKWQCRTTNYTEDFPVREGPQHENFQNPKRICLPRQDFVTQRSYHSAWKDDASTPRAIQNWYAILRDFVRRDITNHSDRLPALSGVAREIARLTGHHYVAGLWREDLFAGLLWSTSGNAKRFENAKEPSWSWASIELGCFNGPPWTFMSHQHPVSMCATNVLGINIQSVGEDPFGQVKTARLHLRGPCRYASELRAWIRESGVDQEYGTLTHWHEALLGLCLRC